MSGEAGALRFEDESDLEELLHALGFLGNEKVKGCGEGFVQFVDDACAAALADFDEALEFQSFYGFAQDVAADTKLLCEAALGHQFALGGTVSVAGEGGELVADLFDEGRRFFDSGDAGKRHEGPLVGPILWSVKRFA